MKQLSKELQMIYDFCEKQKNNIDNAAESTTDFAAQMMLTRQSTAYWSVQTFINVNFVEENGECIPADGNTSDENE